MAHSSENTIVLFSCIILHACFSALLADDFNRPNVGYTNNADKLGWYWQASGAGTWSLSNHEIYVNNSDPSLQESEQKLYNTRVSLRPGDWSASVDIRGDTATRRAGLIFMVGGNGTNHYQVRLQFGSQQVQVLQGGSAGALTIYSVTNSSSEIFSTGKFYTVSAWSTNATQYNWMIQNSGGTNVAAGSFTNSSYTNGYAGIIKSVGDGNSDICHFDNFYVREITIPPITNAHPRLLITPADIVNIKGAINGHVEPRYSAWLNLKSRADSWSTDVVPAPYTGRDSSAFLTATTGAGHKASKMALAYLLKGSTNYSDKAREILLTWARATPLPGTDFDPNIHFPNSGMELARGTEGFILTYDYLYDLFSPAERTDVENWFRAMLPTLQRGIDRWNTPYKMSGSDPRGWIESSNPDDIYFGGQLYQNHVVAHTLSYLLFGYALGDQAVVQFAVDSKDNPRNYLTLFEGTLLMAGESNPDVNSGDPMTPPPQDGEVYDRYRHIDTGSGHTNGAGLSYACLSLHEMTAMTETLYVNGLNFYTRTGAHGENMQSPFSFYADFFRLGDDSIKGGFYTGEGVSTGDYHVAVYEVANKRYPGNFEINDLLNSVARSSIDPGGYVETYFCYPVLTHGVVASWTGTTSSNFEVTGNWEAFAPANDTTTDIGHFDVTPANQPQLTTNRSIAGLAFSASSITLSSADAQVLTLGAYGISSGIAGAGTNTVSAALCLATNQTWKVYTNSTLIVSGVITGASDLTIRGGGILTLSGTNTYSGNTIITNGTLALSNTNSLGANTAVYFYSGATNQLNFTGNLKVRALYINGVFQTNGVYGATNLPAYIKGIGFLDTRTNVFNYPAGTVLWLR